MYYVKNTCRLSPDGKAAAINLAFLLDLSEFDTAILSAISNNFNESQKCALYNFWKNLTPTTAKAWLCMAEFEGRL